MTTDNNTVTLITLSDSDNMLSTSAEDIRGRKVVDSDGDDLGKVDDLLIDDEQRKVRMLRVEHGGILGFGTTASYIPVDAITSLEDEVVHVGQPRDRIGDAPRYDPDVVSPAVYYGELYRHYGYAPYWSAGYVYPTYPSYRR